MKYDDYIFNIFSALRIRVSKDGVEITTRAPAIDHIVAMSDGKVGPISQEPTHALLTGHSLACAVLPEKELD